MRLNDDEYKLFVEKRFPSITHNDRGHVVDIGLDRFNVIRMFMFGCINELGNFNFGLFIKIYLIFCLF